MRGNDDRLERDRREDERGCRAQERGVGSALEGNQEETSEGVEDEDVAFPEVEVQCADRREHEETPPEEAKSRITASSRGRKLKREADPEEQREERVELAVAEPECQPGDGQIERGRRRRTHQVRRHEHKPAEHGEVQEEDASEREPAQGVQNLQPLAVRGRSRVGGRGGRHV